MLKPKHHIIFFSLMMFFSFTNCCTTKNELKEKIEEKKSSIKKDNAPIPLAPGTAEISFLVINFFENNLGSFCKIKVKSVKRYGQSTKPIGVGSEIDLQIKNEIKEKLKILSSTDSEVLLTIENLKTGMGQNISNIWRVVKINE